MIRDLQQQQCADEDPWERADATPKLAQHYFHVFEERSGRNCKTLSIEMPSPKYKMLCGTCVAVGNTMIIGSYPETASKWTVVHDPARRSACVVLKVIALIEENEDEPKFETTIKRLALSSIMNDNATTTSSTWSDFDPSTLVNIKGKRVTLHCPLPNKYTLCGGGFYSGVPVISSMPVDCSLYKAYTTRGRGDMMNSGGAWSIECDKNPSVVAFAVGIRTKRGATFITNNTESATEGLNVSSVSSQYPEGRRSVDRLSRTATPSLPEPLMSDGSRAASPSRNKDTRDNIYISLHGPTWEGRFPGNHSNVTFNMGACNFQDPAAAALFVVPNEAAKASCSKAPPSIWKQISRPITVEERQKKIGKFCSTSKR